MSSVHHPNCSNTSKCDGSCLEVLPDEPDKLVTCARCSTEYDRRGVNCPACGALSRKTPLERNPNANVVIDRQVHPSHYATEIVMLYIRKRREDERHRHAGGDCYSQEVAPGWIVDFDGEGKPIQIEVLNPSKHFPKEILDILPPEFVVKEK